MDVWAPSMMDLIEKLANEKLFISEFTRTDLVHKLDMGTSRLRENTFVTCSIFVTDVPLLVTIPRGARIQRYMSKRVTSLHDKALQAGIFINGISLEHFQSQNQVGALQMTKANSLVAPAPASVLSHPLGCRLYTWLK